MRSSADPFLSSRSRARVSIPVIDRSYEDRHRTSTGFRGEPMARGGSRLEADLGRLLRGLVRLEVGLLVEAAAEEPGDDHGGEAHPLRVEGLGRVVEALALHRDPVLRPLELGLEVAEVGVRLEVRV